MTIQAPARPTLGLCLIVRDEMRYLRACVESVREHVDEIVIVDTGSTDGTDTYARSIADRFERIDFDEDFSLARNAALRLARTDWVLFLDADERLTPGEAAALRPLIRQAQPGALAFSVLRYNFFATGEFYTSRLVRLLRRTEGLRYEGRISESVKASVARLGGRIEAASVFINHFGHCRPLAERDAKAERYLSILREQLNATPDDASLAGYVALNLRILGRFEEARTWSDASIRTGANRPVAWFFRGHVLRALGDTAGALDAFRTAESLGADASATNMAGVMLLTRGELAAAHRAFEDCLERDPLALPARINLGLVHQAREEWNRAATVFGDVAEANPAFLVDDWDGRCEADCYRGLYNETVFRFAGLGYHLAYCTLRATARLPRVVSRDPDHRTRSSATQEQEGARLG